MKFIGCQLCGNTAYLLRVKIAESATTVVMHTYIFLTASEETETQKLSSWHVVRLSRTVPGQIWKPASHLPVIRLENISCSSNGLWPRWVVLFQILLL